MLQLDSYDITGTDPVLIVLPAESRFFAILNTAPAAGQSNPHDCVLFTTGGRRLPSGVIVGSRGSLGFVFSVGATLCGPCSWGAIYAGISDLSKPARLSVAIGGDFPAQPIL